MFNGYTWQTRTLEVRPDRMGEEIGVGQAGFPVPGAIGTGVANAALGVGVFGTPLLGNMSPAAGSLSATGTPGGSALASPAPAMPRFPGLSPFSAGLGEDDVGLRSEATAQASRNLFVGNVSFFAGCCLGPCDTDARFYSSRSTYNGKTSRICLGRPARSSGRTLRLGQTGAREVSEP